MMQVFVLSVCVTEIEIKCRDIVERPRSVGTESSSSSSVCVWQCSTLIQPPGGTVHNLPAPKLCRRKSSYANNFLE